MTCQMCGARVPEGRASCAQCGAMVGRAPGITLAAPNASMSLDTVRVCPRCGFHGTSVSYFATGSHLLVLLGLTVFTSGIGAIIYLLLRGGERICPQCGLKWGRGGYLAPVSPNGARIQEMTPDLGSDGRGKRGVAWALFALAAFFLMLGMAEAEAVLFGFSMMAGAAGFLLRRSGNEARERRREALLQSMHLPVLRLAASRGGRLTVTQVAQELGWTIPRAEKVLSSMEDGYRVMGDVTPEGVIVYDFPELMHMPAPGPQPVPPPTQAPRLMA
ncbi:MAG: hypothetical protein AVDCRST_MAG68-2791 [uncultured Gemmatimonadetes bacterium]|uniref:DZANK-type domain-containing protein n=1 Tax=uncultured Gemmatimonadota bacterium TaxID=203437 RepID=A0A6J4KYG8_9BACT|nr:MAG: hypothetical protein AVDCRST_MAG68-2791 [uncultured Gemmatimonadota bacterium]